jgi:hypothetical protein
MCPRFELAGGTGDNEGTPGGPTCGASATSTCRRSSRTTTTIARATRCCSGASGGRYVGGYPLAEACDCLKKETLHFLKHGHCNVMHHTAPLHRAIHRLDIRRMKEPHGHSRHSPLFSPPSPPFPPTNTSRRTRTRRW